MAAARPSVGFTFTQNIDYRRRGSATAQRNSRRHGSSSSGSGGGGGAGGGAGASTTGTRRIISDARQAVAAQAKSSGSFTMAPRRRTMSPIAPTTGQPARRKGTNGTTGRLTIMEQVFGPGADTPKARSSFPRSRPGRPSRSSSNRRTVSPIQALRTPKRKPAQKAKPLNQRPSLSEQLAKIGNSASAITRSLTNKSAKAKKPLFSAPSRVFVVGRVSCKYPSPVEFYPDRCTYVFHHPFQKSHITMEMFYRDMVDVEVAKRALHFRIPHTLAHFGKDYNPKDRRHKVSIEFNSDSDIYSLRAKVLGHMLGGGS